MFDFNNEYTNYKPRLFDIFAYVECFYLYLSFYTVIELYNFLGGGGSIQYSDMTDIIIMIFLNQTVRKCVVG